MWLTAQNCFSCGSVVEIILFMVLLSTDQFYVIKAAILGSILATMLLCLGLCFFVGGMRREEQSFNEAISEAGSGLLLTAYVVMLTPVTASCRASRASLCPLPWSARVGDFGKRG